MKVRVYYLANERYNSVIDIDGPFTREECSQLQIDPSAIGVFVRWEDVVPVEQRDDRQVVVGRLWFYRDAGFDATLDRAFARFEGDHEGEEKPPKPTLFGRADDLSPLAGDRVAVRQWPVPQDHFILGVITRG